MLQLLMYFTEGLNETLFKTSGIFFVKFCSLLTIEKYVVQTDISKLYGLIYAKEVKDFILP